MISYDYYFRVSYSDTDKMGVMHHSNYVKYFETARWELFRHIGIPYNSIEESGYMLPVFTINSSFIVPAHYDEKLRIKTILQECKGVRLSFQYMLYNEAGIQIHETEIMLACVDKNTFKPCAIPAFIINAIEEALRINQI
jgi:acyl-CoA thioester hydrolase